MLGTIKEEKGATEDEMVRQYHRLNGHEFEQALGHSEGLSAAVHRLTKNVLVGHRVTRLRHKLTTQQQQKFHKYPVICNQQVLKNQNQNYHDIVDQS